MYNNDDNIYIYKTKQKTEQKSILNFFFSFLYEQKEDNGYQ